MHPDFNKGLLKAIVLLAGTAAILAIRGFGATSFFSEIDGIGWVDDLFLESNALQGALVVGRKWTYGPLQYFLCFFFKPFLTSWKALLFYSRFVSIVCSVMTSLNLIYIAFLWSGHKYIVSNKNRFLISMFAFVLIVCSIPFILRAQSGTPYAMSGTFASFLILFALMILRDGAAGDSKAVFRSWKYLAFVTILGCWANYQLIIFSAIVLGYCALSTIYDFRRGGQKQSCLIGICIVGVAFAINATILWLLFIQNHLKSRMNIPHWSDPFMGVPNITSVGLQRFTDFGLYTLEAWFKVVVGCFAPAVGNFFQESSVIPLPSTSQIFGYLWFLLFCTGVIAPLSRIILNGSVQRRMFGLLSFVVFCYTLLNWVPIIPLGASRHSHHLVAVVFLAIVGGLNIILDRLSILFGNKYSRIFISAGVIVCVFLNLVCFIRNYRGFYKASRENVDIDKILQTQFFRPGLKAIVGYNGAIHLAAHRAVINSPTNSIRAFKDITWNQFENFAGDFRSWNIGDRAIIMASEDPRSRISGYLAGLNFQFNIILVKASSGATDELMDKHASNHLWILELEKL